MILVKLQHIPIAAVCAFPRHAGSGRWRRTQPLHQIAGHLRLIDGDDRKQSLRRCSPSVMRATRRGEHKLLGEHTDYGRLALVEVTSQHLIAAFRDTARHLFVCSRDVLPKIKSNQMVEGLVCIGLRASCRQTKFYVLPRLVLGVSSRYPSRDDHELGGRKRSPGICRSFTMISLQASAPR